MPFVAGLVVVAACHGAGVALTGNGRLVGGRDLRARSTSFALGFAFLGSAALLAGLVGAFTRPVLDGVAAAFALVGAVAAVRDARGARLPEGRVQRWLLGAAVVVVAVDAVLASAPPTSGDATAYHLTAPKLWLGAGRIFTIWWDWATFQPFALELNGAYAGAISDGRGAMVAAALLSGLAAVPVYGLGRELAGRTAGAVAALLFVAQGMFLWEATGLFPEAVGGGLVALGAWHLVRFARGGGLADALYAGAAAGVAASTKYHALLFVVAFALVAGWAARRRAAAVGAVAAGAAVALPWYVKNLVVTGNPVYPLATSIFGGKLWGAADAAWWPQSYAGYGPTAWWKAPLFPLMFVLEPGRYEKGYSLSLALLLLAPVGAVVGGRVARRLGVGILAYLVLWTAAMHQITRYLVLVLGLAAPLAAIGLLWCLARRDWWRRAALGVAVLTALAAAATTAVFAYQVGPGVAGTISQARYVQRLTGSYDALHWLDVRLPPDGRVLVFGVRNLYWLDRPYVAYYPPLFAPGDGAPYALRQMRRYDVRYVATLAGVPPDWLRPQLRQLATLSVTKVSSRTLLRTEGTESLRVYAWCRGRGDPCRSG